MPIVVYIVLVHGKYGPTSFITQHAFFSALRVQCVWFTISHSPIRCTFAQAFWLKVEFVHL